MAWTSGTIRLEAAHRIFSAYGIRPVLMNGSIVGYKATIPPSPNTGITGTELCDRSLTQLCVNIVETIESQLRDWEKKQSRTGTNMYAPLASKSIPRD